MSTTQNETIGPPLNGAGPSSLNSTADAMERDEGELSSVANSVLNITDEYVRRSPWLFVGIAAIAGAALGVLLSRHPKDVDG